MNWLAWSERRLGVEAHKVEVRFERLAVEADVRVGSRAVPTLLNSAVNAAQVITTDPAVVVVVFHLRTPPPQPRCTSSSCSVRRIDSFLGFLCGFVSPPSSYGWCMHIALALLLQAAREFSFFFFSPKRSTSLCLFFIYMISYNFVFVGKIEIKRDMDLVRHVEWIVLPS